MFNESTELLDQSELEGLGKPHVAIISTEWNAEINKKLVEGALEILQQYDTVIVENLEIPGCFELPYSCKELWRFYESKQTAPEAIIAFGAVIRGLTPHFEYVAKAATEGILQLNILLPIPVIFGVLTLDNEEQGWERLGGKHGHKGQEAAITALKLIQINRKRLVRQA